MKVHSLRTPTRWVQPRAATQKNISSGLFQPRPRTSNGHLNNEDLHADDQLAHTWHNQRACDVHRHSSRRPSCYRSTCLHCLLHAFVGGSDNAVRVWHIGVSEDKIDLTCVAELERHTKTVNCVRFSPDGTCMASAGDDGQILLWTLQPNDKDVQELGQHCLPSHTHIVLGDSEFKNLENWKTRSTLTHGSDIYDICWSADGTKLISGSVDNKVIIWSISDGGNSCKLSQVLHEHTNFVQGVAFDPLMSFIASQSSDRTCRIFQLTMTGKLKGTFAQKLVIRNRKRIEDSSNDVEHNIGMCSQVESPSSSCASACSSTSSSSFSVELGEPENEGNRQHVMYYDEINMPSFVRRLSFSPDGSFLLSPAGRFRDLASDPSIAPTADSDVAAPGTNKASATSYLFFRNQLARPALQLPCGTPSLAVRFSPVFYKLREPKESLGLGNIHIHTHTHSHTLLCFNRVKISMLNLRSQVSHGVRDRNKQ